SSAAVAPLVGLVALFMPSSLGDSALYTDEQLLPNHDRQRLTVTMRITSRPAPVWRLVAQAGSPE
ncbi:hypothetical protein ACIP1X_27555, partial [Pseudomonas sp. NPDC088885]